MGPYAETTEDRHPGLREVMERKGMDEKELTATRELGHTGAIVARFFEVTTSQVTTLPFRGFHGKSEVEINWALLFGKGRSK